MSRSLVVTRRKRIVYRSKLTEAGEKLSPRVHPMNPYKGAEDVPYEGPWKPELPVGNQITISNRSGARKKI